jgi:hypothetical protein
MDSAESVAAPTCLECGIPLDRHVHWTVAPEEGQLRRGCFDRTDWNWEGYFCPESTTALSRKKDTND